MAKQRSGRMDSALDIRPETMFLSGHGTFAAYRHRIGKAASPHCGACGDVEDAGHVLLECDRHAALRTETEAITGPLTEGSLITVMLRDEHCWKAVDQLCLDILIEVDEVVAARRNRTM
ncbi:uncharacterized protein LOC115874307 [Sitophilus oryzae]|uniref:Uncharacterized protein LOC115874307 n=1 Tax=Sitophilus oryzae TaxID=7048 RepID=A0A6J2X2S0_SITOR|nr:uncharacterized protein LOC115874307 [Sitophilus oryzae]